MKFLCLKVNFEPTKPVDEEFLKVFSGAFAHGQEFEKELRREIATASCPILR